MKFQVAIESDKGAFKCTVDDIQPTRMQDAIEILSVAFNKIIEAYKAYDEDVKV